MRLFIQIAGYPDINTDIVTPIAESTKFRVNGVTVELTPLDDDQLLIHVLKGKLLLNTTTLKQK